MEALKILFQMIFSKSMEAISEKFEVEKWYRLQTDNVESANGSSIHGNIKVGKENNVLVYFHGGGVSVDSYTAANAKLGFYMEDVEKYIDYLTNRGIYSDNNANPFKEWSVIVIPYVSADFHIGQGDYKYKDNKGNPAVLKHHGYTNYTQFLKNALQYINNSPEKLVIAGSSAGGFGAALLASDVMHYFNTENVTVCVDSALLLYEKWHEVAKSNWNALEKFTNIIRTDNITLDALRALREEHTDVKILFTCSYKDGMLGQMQSYLNGTDYEISKKNSALYERLLTNMVKELQEQISNVGIYLFDEPNSKKKKDKGITIHTILIHDISFKKYYEGKSVLDWLFDATNNMILSYGVVEER